jgi:hypothetical protein
LHKRTDCDTANGSARCHYPVIPNRAALPKLLLSFLAVFLSARMAVLAGALSSTEAPAKPGEEENSRDLFSLDSTRTFESDFRNSRLGQGDSLYEDFSYDHRFLIKGRWYFRAGLEYERYDFGGSANGLPDHLQAIYGHLALEYVVHDHAGAGIELDPGAFFQNHISEDALDVPWKIFVCFPLQKDKVFGVIGLGGGIYQNPIVAPGGGIVWLISDKMRLEGVFPKPALVYEPNDNWQFRVLGEILFDSFRTDDVVTPDPKLQLHNAVLQYSEYRLGLQARYSVCKQLTVFAGAGYTFRREFDFFRAGQREIVEPAPYIKIGLEGKF